METIYLLFNSFYDKNLEQYLQGYNGNAYTLDVLYNTIGYWTVGISLLFTVLYYYIINSPKLSRWWHWAIVLIINSAVALFLGYLWTLDDLNIGSIPQSLVHNIDAQGNKMQVITESSCLGFGISNSIVAAIFFLTISMVIKWKSSNCKYSPF